MENRWRSICFFEYDIYNWFSAHSKEQGQAHLHSDCWHLANGDVYGKRYHLRDYSFKHFNGNHTMLFALDDLARFSCETLRYPTALRRRMSSAGIPRLFRPRRIVALVWVYCVRGQSWRFSERTCSLFNTFVHLGNILAALRACDKCSFCRSDQLKFRFFQLTIPVPRLSSCITCL